MSDANPARYLLLRPEGGLNDILCQIGKCWQHARRFGRALVVDTASPNCGSFYLDFSDYFMSRDPTLVLSLSGLEHILDGKSVSPPWIRGMLRNYERVFDHDRRIDCARHNGLSLRADLGQDHAEDLLLHHACGGGLASLAAIPQLRLQPFLVVLHQQRLKRLGPDYMAVHVRYTDLLADYQPALKRIRSMAPAVLFVASDSQLVVDTFRQALPGSDVVSFATRLSQDGRRLHNDVRSANRDDDHLHNTEAILDLLSLACARRLVISKISGWHRNYSGFLRLAYMLRRRPELLKGLLT